MQSSFPSTDGASQVMCSERAADVCIPASAYPDDLTPSQALVQKKRLTSAALSEHFTWLAPSVEGKELQVQQKGARIGADLRAARREPSCQPGTGPTSPVDTQ